MKKISIAISALSFATLAMPALAQQQQQNQYLHEAHLNAVDENADGSISRGEYQNYMRAGYGKLDKDNDGFLSKSELEGIITAEQFAQMDKNSDGKISQDEYMNQVMSDFHSADKGKNGKLD